MTHSTNPKKRIFSLIRYIKLLSSIIFANRNILYLYVISMGFSLTALVFFILFDKIKNWLNLDQSSWQVVALVIEFVAISVTLYTYLHTSNKTTFKHKSHPNFPLAHESADIARQLAQLYIYHRNVSFLLRIKALGAVALLTVISLVGTIEQQMIRSMSSISTRVQKHSSFNNIEVDANKARKF